MIRMLLAGVLLGAFAAFGGTAPARAYEAPWCAVHDYGRDGAYWDCHYPSLKACIPAVIAGNRGFCNPNPAYRGPALQERARYRHRPHRRHGRRWRR